MSKKKDASASILKPLASNRRIKLYLLLRNTAGSSDKIYIFVVAKANKKTYLARFWARMGSTLADPTIDEFDQDTFQTLVNEKAAKKYTIATEEEIAEQSDTYNQYANVISATISEL